jgi:hypothetical protein
MLLRGETYPIRFYVVRNSYKTIIFCTRRFSHWLDYIFLNILWDNDESLYYNWKLQTNKYYEVSVTWLFINSPYNICQFVNTDHVIELELKLKKFLFNTIFFIFFFIIIFLNYFLLFNSFTLTQHKISLQI